MKFPRNAKIFRGQLDAAPFAGVFFILVIFLLLSSLVYTPGVRIDLPVARVDWPGLQGPKVALAIFPNGQLYFENQIIQVGELKRRLKEQVQASPQPLTLVLQTDKAVTFGTWFPLIEELATAVGIKQVVQQIRPRAYDSPKADSAPAP